LPAPDPKIGKVKTGQDKKTWSSISTDILDKQNGSFTAKYVFLLVLEDLIFFSCCLILSLLRQKEVWNYPYRSGYGCCITGLVQRI